MGEMKIVKSPWFLTEGENDARYKMMEWFGRWINIPEPTILLRNM